jgi:hypothetical protein
VKRRVSLVVLMAAVGLWTEADLLACGDKFLVSGRGTRYQRPKNARSASILIYANPASGLEASLRKMPVESLLKREGHRSTKVEAAAQLPATLAGGKFDVVLASSGDAAEVERLLGASPDAPIVVAVCETSAAKDASCGVKASPKERHLLEAIDKAVARRDQNARKAASARL